MNKYFKIIIVSLIPTFINAHTLLLNQLNNEDGTITIVGAFSTGEDASGALVKLETIKSKTILLEKRLNEESELTVKIPDFPYNVIMDVGKGHTIMQKGIVPKGGFIKKDSSVKQKNKHKQRKNTPLSKIVPWAILVAILLLIATIIISIFNTRKLLKELQLKDKKYETSNESN